MPELLEQAIATSDSTFTVDLLDGSTVKVGLSQLAEFIDTNRDNIKFSKSRRRREPLGFPEI